ncbi:hypothetical protein MHBO_002091 [Bonamia ostreae]|uniref:ABC transporter domain-containing protein n=1 Tax=Bonamia ostreae TaxID=126728 RepID=A0ABV2ALZ9_9EUKA
MALLSGGQKSRVAFAVMTFQSPHLIVMDEPTNHLDIETIEALLNAIEEYKGGIIVISHDTHFLSKVANDFWSLTPEKIVRFRDFDEAKKHALQKRIDEILSLD